MKRTYRVPYRLNGCVIGFVEQWRQPPHRLSQLLGNDWYVITMTDGTRREAGACRRRAYKMLRDLDRERRAEKAHNDRSAMLDRIAKSQGVM